MEANLRQIEDWILLAGQGSTDLVFEKYQNGEITSEELQSFYRELSRWSNDSQRILNMLLGSKMLSG